MGDKRELKQKIFIEALEHNKDISKEDIINIGEEMGLIFSKREAKTKIIKKIVEEGFYNRLYDAFEEFIYIPSWKVGDFYNLSTQQIEGLKVIGAIKEESKPLEFWNKSFKGYSTTDTYPMTVLNYDREELEKAYNLAYGYDGYKIRIETTTTEESHKLINELEKGFIITSTPNKYPRREGGYHTYLSIKIPNNSQYEGNKLLITIAELKEELQRTKNQCDERVEHIKGQYEKIFNTSNLFRLMDIQKEYEALKNSPATPQGKNIRGAGRKPKATQEQKEAIIKDRIKGMNYKELSKKYNLSFGTLHKLINEK